MYQITFVIKIFDKLLRLKIKVKIANILNLIERFTLIEKNQVQHYSRLLTIANDRF